MPSPHTTAGSVSLTPTSTRYLLTSDPLADSEGSKGIAVMEDIFDTDDSESCVDSDGDYEVRLSSRDRWSSRIAFILAAVGSAIGLGNFWRFPYFLFKWGGGVFLIPYFFAVFIVGIPMIQLEISLGQIIQRGSIKAFNAISPMMSGIGAAGAFCNVIVASYYSMVIAWALMYLVQTFRSTLPWEGQSHCMRDGALVSNAEYYLYRNVLGTWTETDIDENGISQCAVRAGDNSESMKWDTFGAMIATWVIIYLCVFRGAHYTSKVVYVTVILPVVILLILLGRAVTLDGAELGIEAYLYKWDLTKLYSAQIWVDSISQVLFSLSICQGVMIPYGSYNPRDKPVIADSFIIVLLNSLFSFIAGLVVMCTLGYYSKSSGVPIEDLENTRNLGLVFVTYPTVLGQLKGSNFWCFLLFINLFMLGIDSAFSIVEGYYAVVEDFVSSRFPRYLLLAMIISPCMLLGIFFCQDTGLYWFSTVDHYIQFVIMLIGVTECFALGWMRGTHVFTAATNSKASIIWMVGYVIAAIALVSWTVASIDLAIPDEAEGSVVAQWNAKLVYGLIISVFILAIAGGFSCNTSKLSVPTWYKVATNTGPGTIVEHWRYYSKRFNPNTFEEVPLGHGISAMDFLMNVYARLWTITVKFLLPIILTVLLLTGIRGDIMFAYSSFIDRYQILGWSITILGSSMITYSVLFLPFYPRECDLKLEEITDVISGKSKMEFRSFETTKRSRAS